MGAPHRTVGGALTPDGATGSAWRRRLLAALSAERGALFWIPGLLAATYLLLFAVRVAPTGLSFFTHTTGLRIAIGPCARDGVTPEEGAAFLAAVRQTLAPRGDVVVVDSLRVAQALGPLGDAPDAERFLRAVRPLNPHLGLVLALRREDSGFTAGVTAWDVHEQRRRLHLEARGASPALAGRALAAALHDSVFASVTTTAATR